MYVHTCEEFSLCFSFLLAVLGTEPRTSYMLKKKEKQALDHYAAPSGLFYLVLQGVSTPQVIPSPGPPFRTAGSWQNWGSETSILRLFLKSGCWGGSHSE